MKVYDVYTDLDPQTLTAVGMAVMQKWIEFALGRETLNGHTVAHPTGKMASAVSLIGEGPNHVAVVIDEELAPEAGYLEEGHAAIDLKQYIEPGRAVPMHRGTGYGAPILNQTMAGRSNNVWAGPRAAGFNGVARMGARGTMAADAWVIPAMPAWSPAAYLAQMINDGEFKT